MKNTVECKYKHVSEVTQGLDNLPRSLHQVLKVILPVVLVSRTRDAVPATPVPHPIGTVRDLAVRGSPRSEKAMVDGREG